MSGTFVTFAGVAAHAMVLVAWGIGFAMLSDDQHWIRAAGNALALVVLAGILTTSIVPSAMGAVGFAALPPSQAFLCLTLMGLGLVAGRALARR